MNSLLYYGKAICRELLKVVLIIILMLIICLVISYCIRPIFLTEDECKMTKNLLVITGLGALGTCFTVWIALVSVCWRRILNRPKLKLAVNHELPFCMLIQDDADESTAGKANVVEICGKVFNDSRVVATDCKIICKGIYVFSPDQKSVIELKKLRPTAFPWVDSQSKHDRVDLSRSLDKYFKFAEISYPPQETRNGDDAIVAQADGIIKPSVSSESSAQSQSASIVIFIPGDEGHGTKYRISSNSKGVLLHIAVTCIENPAEIYGIRIDWNGGDPSEFLKPSMLFVKAMGEIELFSLNGVQK